MAEKNFIGNCKKIQNWGISLGIKKQDLEKAIFEVKGEWVNITIVPNLDKEAKKPYAYLNDYENPKEAQSQNDVPAKDDDLPF